MKFTKSVKHKFKNKLKHQTTKASLLDLEAMEGAEYYRKLAEWLDRASRVLFPLSFGTLSAFYWVYYLVIVNELRDATAKGGSEFVKYDQQTDDTRFTDPVLEKVGAIR